MLIYYLVLILNTKEKILDKSVIFAVEISTTSPAEISQLQLEDDELRKIHETFESPEEEVDYATWIGRGNIMNRGQLYRYSPDSEEEEAHLVVPQPKKSRCFEEISWQITVDLRRHFIKWQKDTSGFE